MASIKTAVVTGANRGIGLEIAKQLAQQGVEVMLTARNAQAAHQAAQSLRDDRLIVYDQQLDVTDEHSIQHLIEHVAHTWGKLDILINNAGIFIDRHLGLLDLDLETVRQTMETNLYAPLRLSQTMFPFLKKSTSGRIVNLSSGLGALEDMGPGFVAYSVSKTALNALTIKLAEEFWPHGIKVNCMCPGWVRTEMGGPDAPRTVEQGADTAVWLALEPLDASGCFFSGRQIHHW